MSTNSCACSASTDKFVYSFGGGSADGNGSMKNLLGGKGANLAEMARIGLPVPPGFTITTEVCTYYYDHGCTYPAQLDAQVKEGIARMEQILGRKFGDTEAMAVVVAVRSGARESMPGMMDTILNLGLNEKSVEAMVKATNNPRFAWDCYRRFVQMYGDVVLGVQKTPDEDHEPFETAIAAIKKERFGSEDVEDTKLSADDLKELVSRFKALVLERTGHEFPECPWEQLQGAIGAVFGSWNNDRAIFEAAVEVSQEEGFAVVPEIMVPLVAFKKELDIQKAIIDKVAQQVFEEKGAKVDYLVGTMIEIPRAAVTADEIAETAQFFSFGTNDLTQTGLGMSRDDSGSFLPQYQELEIIKKNVFASIDQNGVGKLMKIAVELGRSTRPDIKLGICGEHGGDPASVKFCNTLGLTYVSCSPYRVPTARLAAAQAALEQE